MTRVAARARPRGRDWQPRVLVRRDGRTPRKRRVRPGDSPLEDRHQPAAGAYAGHRCWRSRSSYIRLIRALLGHPRTWRALRRWHVDPETFVAWVAVESRYAHARNGRDVRVRPATIGAHAALCERQIQRCRAVGRELGLLVDVLPGRRLTLAEAVEVRELVNGHQAGFSTVSAFVIPAWLPSLGTMSPLPEVGRQVAFRLSVICGEGGPSGAARRGEAVPTSSAAALNRRRPPPKPAKRAPTAEDRAALALARGCIGSIGWLRDVSPYRLAPALRRYARAGWTPPDVVDAIDLHQQRNAYGTPTRTAVRRPWALLAWYLRDFDPQADHPHPDALRLRESARPWCGICDPTTRLRDWLTDRPRRCPRCHPATVSR